MPNEKCCYDCAWCILTGAPIESGAIYECVNPLSDKYNEDSIDPWEKHCEKWRGKNGEQLQVN